MKTSKLPFLHRSASGLLACLLAFQSAVPPVALADPQVFRSVAVLNTYDGNGNMTQRTDGNGAVTVFGYDARNRLISVDYPGDGNPDVSFAYDQNGNRTGMTDATGTTTYDYDFFDRLTGIVYPSGNFVLYSYDDAGNRTDLQYGNLLVLYLSGVYTYIHYTFDEDNRIKTVKNVFTSDTTTYTYDAAGNTSHRTLPNGAYTDYGYDLDGRLTNVVHRKADATLICQYGYMLNAIGNRTRAIETTLSGTKTNLYTYDPLDRLDTVMYPDGRFVDYDYDSFGNRTNMIEVIGGTTNRTAYFYDSDSRLLSTTRNGAPEETFAYDATGNLLQKFRVTDGRLVDYVYDTENRLVRVLSGTNNVEYVYNGVGERVAKIVNGVRTGFLNDPNRQYVQVLAETDSSGVASRVYEWGNELINQEDINGAARNYYLHDAVNGSVRRLVNTNAAVVNSYEYDAFGKPTTKVEAVTNDYQFQGEVQEEETGLVFLRARYADSDAARFLTRDPYPGNLDGPQSLSPYVFVSNDPVNRRDPNGQVVWWIPGAVGAVWGGLSYLGTSALLGKPVSWGGFDRAVGVGVVSGYTRVGSAALTFANTLYETHGNWGESLLSGGLSLIGGSANWRNTRSLLTALTGRIGQGYATEHIAHGLLDVYAHSIYKGIESSFDYLSSGRPGGVALNQSATVLLNINDIKGATFDAATGQILLYGNPNSSPTALPAMSLDDLAVAFRAISQGTMPVVSIEDPVVYSPPDWPGRSCFTVRYGPFYTDPLDGQSKVLDVSSQTHFGWVMFDADRQMKCLGLGKDNRDLSNVTSGVPGYHNSLDLAFQYFNTGSVQTRFWFNPKDIQIKPSADGKSMELLKAQMQLSTETMFSSQGQVESTPDAEYFANWFTQNYDAIANEQVTYDHLGQPHYIFKELKQLAALTGIVKWVQDNNIPLDLSFLENYTPTNFPAAMAYTPQTTISESRTSGNVVRTVTITGGVNYCRDLNFGTNGNPQGLAAAALGARASETNLAWTFNQSGTNYNVAALSVDRKEKDGGFSHADTDANLKVNGTASVTLGRYFDTFNVGRTMFGYGWQAQPFALEFKGERTSFNLCARTWEGYGEVYFNDRAGQRHYKMVPSGIYNRTNDPLHIASRFATNEDILVYSYETKNTPGQIFSDNKTRMLMRLADGMLLDFDLDGLLTRIEDRNGNGINYGYDGSRRLASISQPGTRGLTFDYGAQNRVTSATLPDGHAVTYTYDGSGNLATAQYDAAQNGRLLRYAYNADHCLTQVQDENGAATENRSYDVHGRVTGTTQPGVATPISQSFNLTTRRTQTTGPNALSVTTYFDANYDPTNIVDSRSFTNTLTYNRTRDVISEKMPDGRVYQYFYDYRGNRIATVLPNGRVDITLLDLNNNPIITYHTSGGTNFTRNFDADHVMLSAPVRSFSVNWTDYEYDAAGNLTAIIDPNNRTNSFAYAANGNRTLARDGRGFPTGFIYDNYSRLTRTTNALGHKIDYAYDNRDNLIRITNAAGTVQNDYNAKDELVSVIHGDAGVRRTNSYTYNARHQIQSVTDPVGALTVYAYDARGNLTNITHAASTRFAYEYDGLNRLTATRYSGTAGGGKASIIPLSPRGTERLKGAVTITWNLHGDWGTNTNLTIQYSVNGVNWTDIATVAATNQSYVWSTATLVSDSVQLRFVRAGDNSFIAPVTAAFNVLNGGKYYVNDGSTAGDNYCNAPGQTYNGTSVTGLTPASPVNSLQAILDHFPLQPGDVVYVDTGNYSINNDIMVTAADQGAPFKPVTITGPTNGGAAVITHLSPTNSSGCIFITNADWIAVEHLQLTRGAVGIHLFNAAFCTLRYNECFSNGVAAGPGQEGLGAGIWIFGEGQNLVENNVCHANGGNGGNAAGPGMDGGPGRGVGILIDSSQNTIRSNSCYANGARGGAAGSTANKPGYSEGAGILVETSVPPISEGNQVTDNACHDNDAFGRDELQARGGTARSYGIALLETRDSNIERNRTWFNWGHGGDSYDVVTSTGGAGGLGIGYGIYGQDETGLIVTKNISYSNAGLGGIGGDDPSDSNGTGWGAGVYLSGCTGSLVKNNLCYFNEGWAYGSYVSEAPGSAYSTGVELENSAGTVVANNTLVNQSGDRLGGSATVDYIVAQAYLWSGSTNVIFKNNICDAADGTSTALWVESNSKAGFVSGHNDLYVHGFAVMGFWGATFCADVAAWRTASLQDGASITNDPGYFAAGANNFHLRGDSPAIDTGEALSTVQEDGDGETRPADGPDADLVKTQDIGYDEFVDADGDGLSDVIEKSVTLTNPNERDSDFDGLPDDWEVKYGLNPNSAAGVNGAAGDPDADGYSNLQEYLAGSNPNNAASLPPLPPVITAFSPPGTTLFIVEEDSVSFSATATDANNDPLGYAWRLDGVLKSTSNSWVFATTSESSGQTTLSKQYQVELTVTAGADQVRHQWSVVVNNRNHAPVLNFISNVTVTVGSTIQLNPVYSDPDNQNAVPGDDNVLFVVEYSGWMTNATRPTTTDDIGAHTVTVTVRDDGNPPLSTAQTFTVSVLPVLISSPTRSGADFTFSFATIAGKNYTVQYKNSLNDSSWQTLQSVPGDGTTKTITNTIAAASQRFYRLSVQ